MDIYNFSSDANNPQIFINKAYFAYSKNRKRTCLQRTTDVFQGSKPETKQMKNYERKYI